MAEHVAITELRQRLEDHITETDRKFVVVQQEFENGKVRMDGIGKNVEQLCETSNDTNEKVYGMDESVGELLRIFNSAKGFFAVLGWVGTIIKWIVGVGIAIGIMYAWIKGILHIGGHQ